MLDPALTRPGRLSRRVVVPLPDERGRADILAVHMRVVPLAPELDRSSACRALAKITGGFSGAELANVVNEAALLAGRKEAEVGPWLTRDQRPSFQALLRVLQLQDTTLLTCCWTININNAISRIHMRSRLCMQSTTLVCPLGGSRCWGS